MTTRVNWRRWAGFATVDAMLLFGAGSALAAAPGALPAPSLHLPVLLLAGVSLVGVTMSRDRTD